MYTKKDYLSFNDAMHQQFGQKIIKLHLNGGFTCPNRDEKLGLRGCAFCSSKGNSDFAANRSLPISDQISSQKEYLSKKWPNGKYMAYFGSYTSTYANIDYLDKCYGQALKDKDVVALSIATRPDCLSDKTIKLLEKYNKKTFLIVELGLQTIHTKTHLSMNTGYNQEIFNETYLRLKKANIRVIVHLMFNLPNEGINEYSKTINYINKIRPYGVKFHMLYILYNTKIYEMYVNSPFPIMSYDEYTSLISKIMHSLNPKIVIARITSDPPKNQLFLPKWLTRKRLVMQAIEKKYHRELLDSDS